MVWDVDHLIGTVTFATQRMTDLLDLENDKLPLTAMGEMNVPDNINVPKAIKMMQHALENISKRHDKYNNGLRYGTTGMIYDLNAIYGNSVFLEKAAMRAFKKEYFHDWSGTFGDYIAIIRTAIQYVESINFSRYSV